MQKKHPAKFNPLQSLLYIISQKAKTSIVYYSIYMKSRKIVLMNPVENGLVRTAGEGEGGTNLRKEH